MRRLVITGTRHGRADVWPALDAYVAAFGMPRLLILGGDENRGRRRQRGVDLQAGLWARARGLEPVVCYALWDDGPGAGPPRNGCMVALAEVGDHLLAFPDAGSRGTWDCYRKGERAGLHCVEVRAGWVEELQRLAA